MSDWATPIHIASIAAVVLALAGCAAPHDPLADVRARMAAAMAHEGIRTHAAGSLADAQRTLALAAQADKKQDRNHLIYMTERNLDIAGAIVSRREAERELDALRRRQTAQVETPPARETTPKSIESSPIAGRERRQPQTATGKSPSAAIRHPETPQQEATPKPDPQESFSGTAMTIPDLSFESGIAALNPGAKRRLDGLVGYLRRDPSIRVMIEGHSDNVGRHEANLKMSLARAKAVKAYLVQQGIAADRIQTLGQGAKYPIASNETREGRWSNRRVEIAVYRTTNSPDQNARLPKARPAR